MVRIHRLELGEERAAEETSCYAFTERTIHNRDGVIEHRRHEYQRIEAIEHAAVAWNRHGEILDADIAFDARQQEITELARDTDRDAERDE